MISDKLMQNVLKELGKIDNPTLEDFLKASFKNINDCSTETGIKASTLYHVWKGKSVPSRRNEKILKEYTRGLVNWSHL